MKVKRKASIESARTIAEFDREMERRFPWIQWRMPQPITVISKASGLGCRLCIARMGFKGADVGKLFVTAKEFDEHMESVHAFKHED